MDFDQHKSYTYTEEDIIEGEIVNEWTTDDEVVKQTSFFDSVRDGIGRVLNRIRQDNRSLIMGLFIVSIISCLATSTVVRYKSTPVYKIESYSQSPYDYYYDYSYNNDDMDSFFFDAFGHSSMMFDDIEAFLNEIFGGSFESSTPLPFSEDELQEF